VKYVTVNYVMHFSFLKQLLNYFYGKIIQVKLNYAPIYIRATLYAKLTPGKCSKCKNFNVDLLHMSSAYYMISGIYYTFSINFIVQFIDD
jgi:hypothetical protein